MESKFSATRVPASLSQVDLPLRSPLAMDIAIVIRQPSFTASIRLCVQLAGFTSEKTVYMGLEIDPGQWTRIMTGKAHFPQDKLLQLMELCGNIAPLIWLAHKRGYELTPLETELERQLREERDKTKELESKVAHFKELVGVLNGAN